MRPIVLQRETEGEKEREREKKKGGRPSEKLTENWTERGRELNSGREESDKRNRHGSVSCPITLPDFQKAGAGKREAT